ncbi:MAG: hypothetical protein EA381_05450 [Planctomycetaceae bacterium]|nr:MAG: hypothetical protein EA381_05450 [Planctomycetaceae bacterium]
MMLALLCKPATAQTVQVGDWPAPLRVVAEELPPVSDAEIVESEGGGPWLSLSDLDEQSLIDLRRDPWIRFGSRLSGEPDELSSDDEPPSSASGATGYGIRTRHGLVSSGHFMKRWSTDWNTTSPKRLALGFSTTGSP